MNGWLSAECNLAFLFCMILAYRYDGKLHGRNFSVQNTTLTEGEDFVLLDCDALMVFLLQSLLLYPTCAPH